MKPAIKTRYRRSCKNTKCKAFNSNNSTICAKCVQYNDTYNKCVRCNRKGTHKIENACANLEDCQGSIFSHKENPNTEWDKREHFNFEFEKPESYIWMDEEDLEKLNEKERT